jgi:SWI/SNF-related matrix-associated actin-dependent regulator 1 of chromatin subfamily A
MTKLRQFQMDGVKAIYHFNGRALLADEMGLGKTIQSLFWLTKIPNHRPAIIVTPASVKYNWQVEARQHFNLQVDVLEGNRPEKTKTLPGKIIVLNYDILPSWLPVLLKMKPQCVVFDEIQFIKEPTSQRTKASLKLVENAVSVVGLSGTPLTNRPIELWTSLKAIRPDLFPDRYKFAWKFCKPRHTRWGWKFDGAANMPELHRILNRECMIRRLKKDVLKELPEMRHRMVSFKLKSYKEYDKAQDDFIGWLRSQSPAKANRAKRAQAMTKVGYLLRLTAKLKLAWTEKWIADFFESHPGEKLVAFSMHTFVLEHLMERFRSRALLINGSVTGKKRQETVFQFQNNRRFDLMLGNWVAAGVGITLTAASNVVSLDFPWTPGDVAQGRDRVHRIGQTDQVFMHYLVALGTVDEKLMKLLHKKSKILDAILDGAAADDDINILDELVAELKRR